MKQRWGKHDTEEGVATKVCGVQATEGRRVGRGVPRGRLRTTECTGDTGLRGIWEGQGLERVWASLEDASGEASG